MRTSALIIRATSSKLSFLESIMPDWLDQKRAKIFNDEDRELYLHLGYFLSWFSAVEAQLTMMIAFLTDSKNLENFDLLARGLQPRQKVERLRILASKYRPLGPNLTALLDLFEEVSIPLRNDLSHSRLVHAHRPGTLLVTTIARLTEEQGARTISAKELFERGYWLHCFQYDLGIMSANGLPVGRLEIDAPMTPVRKAENPGPQQRKTRAPLGRRDRKRMRKGQSPRGKRSE
jgi:hypothetical protein